MAMIDDQSCRSLIGSGVVGKMIEKPVGNYSFPTVLGAIARQFCDMKIMLRKSLESEKNLQIATNCHIL
ncbi:MAG: hypothetical protein EA001_06225 [Oscillatoriales cyanobacterium]|nr:MAG: hypothetical protein EA001_06225 [Oscillatoriales cyanobacterium]